MKYIAALIELMPYAWKNLIYVLYIHYFKSPYNKSMFDFREKETTTMAPNVYMTCPDRRLLSF